MSQLSPFSSLPRTRQVATSPASPPDLIGRKTRTLLQCLKTRSTSIIPIRGESSAPLVDCQVPSSGGSSPALSCLFQPSLLFQARRLLRASKRMSVSALMSTMDVPDNETREAAKRQTSRAKKARGSCLLWSTGCSTVSCAVRSQSRELPGTLQT